HFSPRGRLAEGLAPLPLPVPRPAAGAGADFFDAGLLAAAFFGGFVGAWTLLARAAAGGEGLGPGRARGVLPLAFALPLPFPLAFDFTDSAAVAAPSAGVCAPGLAPACLLAAPRLPRPKRPAPRSGACAISSRHSSRVSDFGSRSLGIL